ncbi:helix-turn-helix transcriptional regulator [Actinoplanes sp. NPDC051343]|uniref:helix-turn-helix transcriptional regulator n=1 Tax=Actinoplanes sp. NPDC051343 TaxID=3363906 RepID=UPI0037B9E8D5
MNSRELASFLRARRAALQPDEPRGRRRTAGLRREEVAARAAVSADYYRRLEQARVGPPSLQVMASLVRALQLTSDERDYLYRLTEREPPVGCAPSDVVAPALRQVVESLGDSPAAVMTMFGDSLLQNPAATALLGDTAGLVGEERNTTYRWFTDPSSRAMHPVEEHEEEGRSRVANLRARAVKVDGPRADRLIGLLRRRSAEFERFWLERKVAICRSGTKTFLNPRTGPIDLDVQILDQVAVGQVLVVFTAAARSPAAAKLGLLSRM